MSDSKNTLVKNTLAAFGLFLALLACAPVVSRAQVVKQPSQTATTSSVKGSGTPGRITKWTGNNSPSVDVSDSVITESNSGQIGIGTATPTSKLTVAGTIETTLGGYKFADGTVQTTAALASINHDATLTGNGSAGSPLGIASGQVVRSLNGLKDNLTLAAGSNITITPTGDTLTIASTAADPEQNAFQRTVELIATATGGFGHASIPVPSGKRLVIEYLSMYVVGDKDFQPMEISTTVAGVKSKHFMQLADKQVRIFSDSDVDFAAISRSGDTKNVTITVSGRLVDLP